MKILVFIFFSLFGFGNLHCQSYISWSKSYGGNYIDEFNSVVTTNDGGFICAGNTFSNASFIDSISNINYSSQDAVIVKINSSGIIQWKYRYGGSGTDVFKSIQSTSDGGYIACGSSSSNDGNVTGNKGSIDAWVVKLDSTGVIQWQKCYGGSSNDDFFCIKQINDGGFICSGSTISTNGDAIGNNGGVDAWLVRLNSTGVIQWQKSFGGTSSTIPGTVQVTSGSERFNMVQQTSDGGFVCAGYVSSNNGDASGFHISTYKDGWVVKVNSLGIMLWQKCLGGVFAESIESIEISTDGGFICSGSASSNDGDVIGLHFGATNSGGMSDAWIIKLSSNGNLLWNKCYGGGNQDLFWSSKQTSDGGIIACGFANSNNGDVYGNTYGAAGWVLKTNYVGNIEWQRCMGGSDVETLSCINESANGEFILCGKSRSFNGDLDTNYSDFNANLNHYLWNDGWMIKLNECNSTSASYSTINKTACQSYLSPSGTTYNISGTYLDTIANHNGCDSIITINLTINQPVLPTFTQVDPICYGSNLNALPSTSLNGISGVWSPQLNNHQTTNYTFIPTIGQCASNANMSIVVNQNTASQISQTANNTYTLNGQTYTQSGTYTQVIPNANGCDSTITLNLTINNSGIDEVINSAISIYPNPANNHVTINYAGEIQKVEIMDAKGAKVYSSIENKKEIILPSNIQTGYYLVLVHTPEGVFRKELVINR